MLESEQCFSPEHLKGHSARITVQIAHLAVDGFRKGVGLPLGRAEVGEYLFLQFVMDVISGFQCFL